MPVLLGAAELLGFRINHRSRDAVEQCVRRTKHHRDVDLTAQLYIIIISAYNPQALNLIPETLNLKPQNSRSRFIPCILNQYIGCRV